MRDEIIRYCSANSRQLVGSCVNCSTEFRFRSNKKFCSSNCRKRYGETKKNSVSSPTKWRANMELFDSASRIAEIYFQLPVPERDKFMCNLIEQARSGENKRMRQVLSNKVLLDKTNNWGNPYKGKRGKAFGSIAQEAQSYCQIHWGANVRAVVYGLVS